MVQAIDLRRGASRRIFHVLGTAFVVVLTLCFFQFRLPNGSPFGHKAKNRQRWAAASGLLRDIRNTTLGFEKIFVVGLPSRSDRRDGMVLQAALSDMGIEFIDGVLGNSVPDKALAATSADSKRLPDGSIGSWRAHLNAARDRVQRNLTSALILEDDTDWDIRIRDQLYDFALSAQALTQPLRGLRGGYADPMYPQPSEGSPVGARNRLLPPVQHRSPDHLAVRGQLGRPLDRPLRDALPLPPQQDGPQGPRDAPRRRDGRAQEEPVDLQHPLHTLKETCPEHTRAYHDVQEGVCTLGYALNQRGARKLLHEVALKEVTDAYDLLLRFFCEGEKGRAAGRQCLTTQPGLFQHHRTAGRVNGMSDISSHGDKGEFREKPITDMIRWRVRLNVEPLLEGRADFVDQFPDE